MSRGKNTAFTFYHHVAYIGCCTSNEGNAFTLADLYLLVHPLGTRSRLSESTTGKDEPYTPVPLWLALLLACPDIPVVEEFKRLFIRERVDNGGEITDHAPPPLY